jgi:hypothetical protein
MNCSFVFERSKAYFGLRIIHFIAKENFFSRNKEKTTFQQFHCEIPRHSSAHFLFSRFRNAEFCPYSDCGKRHKYGRFFCHDFVPRNGLLWVVNGQGITSPRGLSFPRSESNTWKTTVFVWTVACGI